MKSMLVAVGLAAFGVTLYQTLPPAAPASEAAVRQADETWAKAVAAKSVEQTLAMYDPDAVTAGSAMFPARGVAAFRSSWASVFAQPGFNLTWRMDAVVVLESGSIAYSSGRWSSTGPDVTGPYLAVWRKQPDGQWKVLIDAAWYDRSDESRNRQTH